MGRRKRQDRQLRERGGWRTGNDGQRRTVTWGGGKDKTDNERRGERRQTMADRDGQ